MWVHGVDPIERLQIDKHLDNFRQSASGDNKVFFRRLIDQYLLSNPHRLTLVTRPDKEYMSREAEEEKRILKEKVDGMTQREKDDVYEKSVLLLERQKIEPGTATWIDEIYGGYWEIWWL